MAMRLYKDVKECVVVVSLNKIDVYADDILVY